MYDGSSRKFNSSTQNLLMKREGWWWGRGYILCILAVYTKFTYDEEGLLLVVVGLVVGLGLGLYGIRGL